MKMEEIEVYADQGQVCITQDGGKHVIRLAPEQVGLVAEWLEGAAKQLSSEAHVVRT